MMQGISIYVACLTRQYYVADGVPDFTLHRRRARAQASLVFL